MVQDGYKLIVSIVNKGKAGKVVDASHIAGAEGSTIIYGHDAAVRLMLGISIEPEKEVILTIAKKDKVQAVMDALMEELELNEPHKGIVFVISLDQLAGLHEET